MNSKNINTCKNCNQAYCLECTNAEDYQSYCSKQCEKNEEENLDDD